MPWPQYRPALIATAPGVFWLVAVVRIKRQYGRAMRRIGRWLVIGAACVIALLLFLLGGLVLSSNANAHRPLDLLAGRLMFVAATGMSALAVLEAIRPSSLGSKLLLGAVLTASVGFCVLVGFVVGPW